MAIKKMTDADKAKLKKNLKKVNLDKPVKKTSTSYSPAPMSAAAKAKAANRGALSNSLSKMGLKQVNFDKKAKKK